MRRGVTSHSPWMVVLMCKCKTGIFVSTMLSKKNHTFLPGVWSGVMQPFWSLGNIFEVPVHAKSYLDCFVARTININSMNSSLIWKSSPSVWPVIAHCICPETHFLRSLKSTGTHRSWRHMTIFKVDSWDVSYL